MRRIDGSKPNTKKPFLNINFDHLGENQGELQEFLKSILSKNPWQGWTLKEIQEHMLSAKMEWTQGLRPEKIEQGILLQLNTWIEMKKVRTGNLSLERLPTYFWGEPSVIQGKQHRIEPTAEAIEISPAPEEKSNIIPKTALDMKRKTFGHPEPSIDDIVTDLEKSYEDALRWGCYHTPQDSLKQSEWVRAIGNLGQSIAILKGFHPE